ncbi:hypothetical protein ACWDA9_41640, partial [Streptomyces sp. NPDC001193]
MRRPVRRYVLAPAGAGIAVAAGLVLAGLATDGGGSGAPDGRAGAAMRRERCGWVVASSSVMRP